MRIISLVPSWTETLIEAGHLPIGRTRFCIYPESVVKSIPVVGGTKSVDWDNIRALKPDLLILDREENPLEFSQQGVNFWASHVRDGHSLAEAFEDLGRKLNYSKINEWAVQTREVCEATGLQPPEHAHFPGATGFLRPWRGDEDFNYVIWKNPWMVVQPNTYIGFVLSKLGIRLKARPESTHLYPPVEIEPNDNQVYLFSSEPYPFLNMREELSQLGFKGLLVDGEKFSWFGIRSLRFLQEALRLSKNQ